MCELLNRPRPVPDKLSLEAFTVALSSKEKSGPVQGEIGISSHGILFVSLLRNSISPSGYMEVSQKLHLPASHAASGGHETSHVSRQWDKSGMMGTFWAKSSNCHTHTPKVTCPSSQGQ